MITTKELPLYPIFKSGQNLTHDDLNNLRNYLANQNRLTRTHLIGTGIFYGLEVSLMEGKAVKISKGVGVTSNGHLISMNEAVYTEFEEKEIPISWFLCDKDSEQEIMTVNVIELLEASSEKEENQEEEGEGDSVNFDDKVVVLLYEETERIREICMHTADENGKDGEALIRKLLMNRVDYLKISTLTATKNVHHEFLDPYMERLGFEDRSSGESSEKGLWIENLDTYQLFIQSYREVGERAENKIADAFSNASSFFNAILGGPVSFDNLDSNLQNLLGSTSTPDGALSIQYIYSYFRDLIDAYRELTHLDIFQSFSGFPDECRFHNHLNLGGLVPVEGAEAQSSRTPFLKVPVPETGYSGQEEARFIKEKMHALVSADNLNFQIQSFNNIPIKITASKSPLYPLSERAIPYYYTEELRNKWNFKLNRKKKANNIPSYHNTLLDPHLNQPLLYDLGSWDFFRIEGHIGQELKAVLPTLENERKRLNVPFDMVVLKIEEIQEPKILEGKFTDLQLIYRKVREDIICSGQDNSTLKDRFPEKLKDFNCNNISEFQDSINGDNQSIRCNIKVLEEICTLYKERLERLHNIQYFHSFAKEHPGLEHMGGVYSGGTFILLTRDIITNESESRNNTDNISPSIVSTQEKGLSRFIKTVVVADFCLPYICCSKSPKVVHDIREKIPPMASFEEKQRDYIYKREGAGVNRSDCVLAGQKISFINTSVNATMYEWLVDGKSLDYSASKADFEYDFLFTEDKTEFEVRLVAFSDGLTDEEMESVNICPDEITIYFPEYNGDNPIVITLEEDKIIAIVVSPEGGEFRITEKTNGNLIESNSIIQEDDETCQNILYNFNLNNFSSGRNRERVGSYKLFYSIGPCNLEKSIDFEIVEEQIEDEGNQDEGGQDGDGSDDVLISPPASLPEAAISLLNKRTAETRENAQKLGEEDQSLSRTKSFKRSLFFIDNPGNNIEDIHSNFKEAFQLLARNLSTKNKKRKDQYINLSLSIIGIYLDRLVALNQDSVPDAAKDNISLVIDQLKKAEIDINTVKESWDPDALKESLQTDSLDQLNKLVQ